MYLWYPLSYTHISKWHRMICCCRMISCGPHLQSSSIQAGSYFDCVMPEDVLPEDAEALWGGGGAAHEAAPRGSHGGH